VRYSLLIICFLLSFVFSLNAQIDTLQVRKDSVKLANDTAKVEGVKEKSVVMTEADHSPKKAGMLSAILPGLGQAYNRKYWKIPVVYAILGGVGYLAYTNTLYYNFWHGALIIKNNPYHTDLELFNYATAHSAGVTDLSPSYISTKISETDFQTENDYYRRNRDLSYFFTGVLYLCNILDATVDGHLYNYNVDDNLSFHIQPTVFSLGMANSSAMGLSFNMKF
jgi:hypothetical protein